MNNIAEKEMQHTTYTINSSCKIFDFLAGLMTLTVMVYFSTSLFTSSIHAADFQGNLIGVSITNPEGTNQPPTAKYTYTQDGDTFIFDASVSSDPDGNITSYKWNFSDEKNQEGKTIQFTPTSKETILVTLTVVDDGGAVTIYQNEVKQITTNTTLTSQSSDSSYNIPNTLYSSEAMIVGQSFSVPQQSILAAISLYTNSLVTTNITIRVGTSTNLSSNFLTSGTYAYGEDSPGEFSISLDDPVLLTPNMTYYFAIFADGNYSNRITLKGSASSKYSNGEYLATASSWPLNSQSKSIDLFFKILGQEQ